MIALLLGYMWLFIHRPFEVWAWMGAIRLERVYMITCLIFWFFLHEKSVVRNRNVLAILGICAAILFSDLMTNDTGKTNIAVEEWMKMLVYALLILVSVRGEKEFKILMTGFSVIFFFYMLHSYYEFKFNGRHVFRMGIPRLCGIGETMSDPNSFGASVVYSLPLLVPLWLLFRGKLAILSRTFCVLYMALAVICILDTGSRAAMIGMLAFVMMTVVFSKHRVKIMLVFVFFAPIMWLNMDARMQNRYLTIIDPSKGPANAQESAEGRVEGLKTGLMLFQKSPIYGVGPGQSQNYTMTKLQTHNFLGQVLGELGAVGLAAFIFLCITISLNYLTSRFLFKIHSRLDANADDYLLSVSHATFVAMILLLLLGLGSHNGYRYTWIWFAAFQGFAVEALRKRASDAVIASAEKEQEAVSQWERAFCLQIPYGNLAGCSVESDAEKKLR